MPTQRLPKKAVKKTALIPMRGDLGITVRDAKTGKKIRRIEIRNTITNIALGYLVELITQNAGTPVTAYQIAKLAVGDGNTAPTRGDTALASQVAILTLSDSNRIPTTNNPFELKIVATLDAATGNGSTLCEAGLFTAGGAVASKLFARQIHPGIPKTNALVIDYDWRIAFTA